MKLSLHLLGLAAAYVLMLLLVPDAKAATVTVTSFNPATDQTDHDACTGASGRNLCTAAREGDRVIALSRDLLWKWGGPFRWHDKVQLHSNNPACNGVVLSVEDTMHRRFAGRADLFFLDRRSNTSCTATLERVAFSR